MKSFAKYLFLSSVVGSILPTVAMEAQTDESGLPQPIHPGSESMIKELLVDPIKWNIWLIGLINEYFGKQYERSPTSITRSIHGDGDIIVPRPNHALGHGMRQGFLAVNILDGFEYVHPKDFTSPGTADLIQWIQMKLKTDPYFRQKIQFTAAFQRTGRQSEADVSTQSALVGEYEYQDSENFYKAAKDFVGPGLLFNSEQELILYKQSILKNSKLKDAVIGQDNKELQYLRKVILTSHTLDLRRLVKTEFNEPTVIANATKSLFGPETAFSDPNFTNSHVYPQFKKEGDFMKRLWEYSGEYLKATGDRYDGAFEDKFFIQAKHPDQMVTALIEAEKRLRSVPHPVGIFLYSACPVEAKKKISVKFGKKGEEVKGKGEGMQAIEPQPSYEWCALFRQREDGTYGPLGSFATPFEDEADVARRGVREESGGLYDIDPATFDRDVITPVDKSETLPELRRRSLTRLPNETAEQHKARLNSMASPEEMARHDLRSSEGETLQDLKARRAFQTLPSSVQDKTGQHVNNTLFFKEVPFHEAKKFLGESSDHKESEYVWIPVRYLVEMVNQPTDLKIDLPFMHLLSQQGVKEYLEDKIVAKPIPMAVINKIKANIELKNTGNEGFPNTVDPNAFTMFDKYAKNILGTKFSDDPQSNLQQIIAIHNNEADRMLLLSEQHPQTVARDPGAYSFYQITPDIQQKLLRMTQKEGQLYPWFVFYHAVPPEIYQIYEFCREFRSLIGGKSLKDNLVLRGLDDAFSIIQNIEDFYQKSLEKYNEGGAQTLDKTDVFRKQGMSVNMTLFGGMQEAIGASNLKAEYSIHRWLGAYSDINNPNFAQEVVAQFLGNLGIPKERAKRYQDLYKKYFTPSQAMDWKNVDDIKNVMQHTDKRGYGVMLQVFINPEVINEVAYLAGAGGNKFTLPIEKTPEDVLKEIRSQSENSDQFKGVQTRLFLKPDYFQNPKYVKMFSYFSKDLEKPEKERQEKLEKLVTEDEAFLLSSNAPVTKESVGEDQPLLELHERVTGNVREQTDVADQKVVDWFSAKQTEAIRAYYDKNPAKENTFLKNIHNLSYGDDEIKTPANGYMPIHLSLMYKNQELFLYFLEKLDAETQKSFLSTIIPVRSGYRTRQLDPLGALAFVDFNLKEVVPRIYAKLGDTLFDSLFLTEEVAGIAEIMETFDQLKAIPQHYLENLFSKPAYLRGLKYIKAIPLSEDQAKSILNKTFDGLWSAFKGMPFFAGDNLFGDDQRYYNILFKGTEKNYKPIATLYLMNKFTFSYFETFLQSIRFDQFYDKLARAVFNNELGDDFIKGSIKHFLSLIKVNLPKEKPMYKWQSPPDPVWTATYDYESTKKLSLDGNEPLIFNVYMHWLYKFSS